MSPWGGVRSAVCVNVIALLLAGAPLDVASGETRGGDSSTRHAAFLGPKGDKQGWMPSRAKPRSVVWAVGDGANRTGECDNVGVCASGAVAAMIAAHRVHRFLYLGDVYNHGTAQEFESNYRPLFGRFDPIAAPTPGNHEWPNFDTGYRPYWGSARGTPPPHWYAFSASGWQLLSLNSNLPTDPVQLAWLRKKVTASPRYGDCRIAFMHEPRFSAGVVHGDEPKLEAMWQALVGHAKVLLGGDDHNSQRLYRVDGITQLVAGAGGNGVYLNRPHPLLAFGDDDHYAALRMKLRPGRAVLSFVAADGSLLDRSAVGCRQRE